MAAAAAAGGSAAAKDAASVAPAPTICQNPRAPSRISGSTRCCRVHGVSASRSTGSTAVANASVTAPRCFGEMAAVPKADGEAAATAAARRAARHIAAAASAAAAPAPLPAAPPPFSWATRRAAASTEKRELGVRPREVRTAHRRPAAPAGHKSASETATRSSADSCSASARGTPRRSHAARSVSASTIPAMPAAATAVTASSRADGSHMATEPRACTAMIVRRAMRSSQRAQKRASREASKGYM
ncbi:unnamed protein product [Phaeothamnion confervicola]